MPADTIDRPSQTPEASVTPGETRSSQASAQDGSFDRLAARESRLWNLTLIVLSVLALGLAAISWQQIKGMPWKLEALPIGLVVLVTLFGAYVLAKSREMAALRGLVRGLEYRASSASDVERAEKLFQLVAHSQQGYRELIDTFEEPLFSISLRGEILAANRAFADLLDRPFTGLVGRPVDEFLDMAGGTGRAAALNALPKILERGHWSGVLRIRLKRDSSPRYFRCTVHSLVRDTKIQGLCVLARDITRERETESRFSELFETLQEGVYLATADGKFENFNPAMARILGFDNPAELFGRSLSEFVVDPQAFEKAQNELAKSGSIHGAELMLRRRDGSVLTCLHAVSLIRDSGGRLRRSQGSLVDISERREIQQRLHREQQFARRLVESFPDLVVVLDRAGRYTFVSPRSNEILAASPEELLGRPLGEMIDPQDRKEVRALLDKIVSGECPSATIEYLVERKDGEMRLLRAMACPLYDSTGAIEGVIASARDVTDAKRMEQQLIQTERLAAMGQMIAGVAHELNNPLTAVLGVTELLRDSAATEASRRQLELAHRQARRAAQIVQSLLTFSRPPQPRKTCVQLSELIQRSLQLHEHSLRTNHITVDFVPKPELPVVLGDASQLTQVFLNLIANAEQAIHEIRDHGTLRIRVAQIGDRIMATFQDDGIGIRREILPKLFDPFFTTKRPGRGTGLGLSICLAILREHSGQIEAQPLADGGSVFTVSLPVASGTALFLTETSSAAAPAKDAPKSDVDRLSGSTILVVDDEESIRQLVCDGLEVRGARVDAVATAREALELFTRQRYDAVLCDLNLGGAENAVSGRQLHAHIMNGNGLNGNGTNGNSALHAAKKPVFFFMTGELVDGAAMDELTAGHTQTLQKPFRISDLINILTNALSGTPLPVGYNSNAD